MGSPISERATVFTLLVLTFTAGLIDAVCFLKLGHIFVANMTGNIIFLGVSLATAGRATLGSFVSLGAYLFGAMLGGRIWRQRQNQPRVWLASAWSLHALLLICAALLATNRSFTTNLSLTSGFIALLAIGFGMQNATVRIFNIRDLTTTVLTASITLLAAESRFGTGKGPSPWRKILSITMILLGAAAGAGLMRFTTAGVVAIAAALVTLVALIYAFAPSGISAQGSNP